MKSFQYHDLVQRLEASGRLYLEFLKEPSLSLGLYSLEAGEQDPQTPHAEDEVYYVIAGRGHLQVGHENIAVGPGAIVYVPAGMEHRFYEITEHLLALVFFSPAEGSQTTNAG